MHFLFIKILNTIIKWQTISPKSVSKHSYHDPRISKYDVLKCRLLSHSWNTAVETCYERPVMTGLLPFLVEQKNLKSTHYNQNEWTNAYTYSSSVPINTQLFVSEFIEGRVNTYKNPFLGRFIEIEVEGVRNTIEHVQIYTNAMSIILQKFGTEIWYVKIFVDFLYWSTTTESYLKLVEWLNYVPNLRSLEIRFNGQVDQNIIKTNPLPQLDNLIHLKVADIQTGDNIMNELFEKYNHVYYLEIVDYTKNCELNPHTFKNLKGFYIKNKRKVCSQLLHWIGNNAKLQTLYVYNHENNVRICRQLQIMNMYWSTSLTDLTLKIGDFQLISCTKNLELKLPILRRLNLTKDQNLVLDFLQPLQNLKVLEVTLTNSKIYCLHKNIICGEQKIQFVGYEARMQESNIWYVLGSLNVLKIQFKYSKLCYDYTKSKAGTCVRKILCLM